MKEKGFTLIETIVAIIIFAVLVLAIVLFFERGTTTWVRSQPYLEAQEMARKAFYGEIGGQLGMVRELRAADSGTIVIAGSSISFQRGIIDGGNRTCESTATDTNEAVQVFSNGATLPAPGLTVVAPQRGETLWGFWPGKNASLGGDDKRPTIKYRLDGTDLIREVREGAGGWGMIGSFQKDKDFDLSNNPDNGIIASDVAGLTFGAITNDTLTITLDMGIDYKGSSAYEDIKTFSTTIRLPNM